MNIKNIQTVHSISESNSLAQVECVHENLKTGYRKRGYINKLGQEITPLKYWHCHYFYGDIAVAENFDHTSEVIDKSGIVLLKSKPYREIYNLGNGSVLVERKKQGYEMVKIKG